MVDLSIAMLVITRGYGLDQCERWMVLSPKVLVKMPPSSEVPELVHLGIASQKSAQGMKSQWFQGDYIYIYIPSGNVKIAIENDHRNSGFSH